MHRYSIIGAPMKDGGTVFIYEIYILLYCIHAAVEFGVQSEAIPALAVTFLSEIPLRLWLAQNMLAGNGSLFAGTLHQVGKSLMNYIRFSIYMYNVSPQIGLGGR